MLRLDGDGRLLAFEMVPEGTKSPAVQSGFEWPQLFAMAGLNIADWTPAAPAWNPPYFADAQTAWTGSLPGGEGTPMRIEAATYAGRPVSFSLVGPWTRDARSTPAAIVEAQAFALFALSIFALTAMTGSAALARRNLRLGRGDRKGASRVALFTGVVYTVSWILNEHHVASFGEFSLFVMALSFGAMLLTFTWLAYIAVEPFVRRRWPHMLVSWTRLLAGDWRDSLAVRDVLIGCAAGACLASLDRVSLVLPRWLGRPEVFPIERSIGYAFASGVSPFRVLDAVGWSIGDGLMALVVYLLLRIVHRSDRAANISGVAIFTILSPFWSLNHLIVVPVLVVKSALTFGVLLRVGLLALVVTQFVVFAFQNYPITFGLTAWYSSIGYSVLLAITAFVVYGFLVSTRGHRLVAMKPVTSTDSYA